MKVYLQTENGRDLATAELPDRKMAPDIVISGHEAFKYHITVLGGVVYRRCSIETLTPTECFA